MQAKEEVEGGASPCVRPRNRVLTVQAMATGYIYGANNWSKEIPKHECFVFLFSGTYHVT
jgi:hypothetical protein